MGSFRQVAFKGRLQEVEQEKRVDGESEESHHNARLGQSTFNASHFPLANPVLLLQLC